MIALIAGAATSGWAYLAITAVGAGLQFDLDQMCPAGDPGDPVLTDKDFRDVMDTSDIFASGTAAQRIHQWLQHMLFPIWCNCSNGTAPPNNVSVPLPGVGLNPGLPAGPVGATCWDANSTIGPDTHNVYRFNAITPKNGDLAGWPSDSPTPPQLLPTPLPTQVWFTGTLHSSRTPLPGFHLQIQFYDAAGALISGSGYFGTSHDANTTDRIGGVLPAAAAYADFALNWFGTLPNQETATGRVEYFCGSNTPTTPVTPCCPPDPTIDVRLRRIEDFEHVIIQLLGHGELSHVDGTRHAGLSGSGSVLLVDSVDAVRVEVTSSLAGWPSNPGVPTYYFSLGFITSIAAESPLKGWRLVYGSQTFPIASYADQIGYTLPPGVRVDIVELLPSP